MNDHFDSYFTVTMYLLANKVGIVNHGVGVKFTSFGDRSSNGPLFANNIIITV
jgi:hypothetical protein